MSADSPIQPFAVNVSQETLDDLKSRLAGVRWPDEIDNADWSLGANLRYMRELVDYWRDRFDWRAQERAINLLPQFTTDIDGLSIHFVHVRDRHKSKPPLLITHGWPSSFVEMTAIIPLLRDEFDLIIPSLPGCGFSQTQAGMSKHRIAAIFAKLMSQLGYDRFFAHGGDIGAGVTVRLALDVPDRVRAIHVMSAIPPYLGPGSAPLSREELDFVALNKQWMIDEGGYIAILNTRPQTLAFGLTDSPAGLAAWIVEKFRAWSDCAGDVERRFTKDQLLTNIMIYWLTGTIGSSMRLYYENRLAPNDLKQGERIQVPTALALTTEPVDRCPRAWTERSYNLKRFTQFASGGHFMAIEEPELLARDIREFFREFQ